MKHIPCVAIIIENMKGEVLLFLRDDKPTIVFPNHWTLVGGTVEDGETRELAAHRELKEETGLKANLSFWKRYDRRHPLFVVDQHIYTAKVDTARESVVLGEGQDIQFFKPPDVKHLKIAYEFGSLLNEYFQIYKP